MKIWKHLGLALVGASMVFVACVPAAAPAPTAAPAAAPKTGGIKAAGNFANGNPSTASGQLQVVDLGAGKSRITVRLTGLTASTSHMGHIHVGTCAAVGPVAVALPAITADAAGNGTASAEIEPAKLPADIYVAYHQRGPGDPAGIGGFIACGEIPK
jgi:hypothetical protein